MKWLLRSIPLIVLVSLSCTTTTNNYVTNSLAPTITRFSPDTVWTLKRDTIYGTNFGFANDGVRVWIDTVLASYADAEDTMIIVIVPQGARTGLIRVWSYEQTATSAKPVVVNYTFNPQPIDDTIPDGSSFSISGTGMNNFHGLLRLFVGGIMFPIDSVFPDRIVSHVPTNSPSGAVTISDSNETYSNLGVLTVIRPSSWVTLSQIHNYINVTETHRRYRYTNGQAAQDSTWSTKASYAGQQDTNVGGIKFARTSHGLSYNVQSIQYNNVPLLQIVWDTVGQTAKVTYQKYSYIPSTPMHSLDTEWAAGYQNLQAPLPVDNDIEFVLPGFQYSINEDSTDTQGSLIWRKSTSTQVTSGEFDIILKH